MTSRSWALCLASSAPLSCNILVNSGLPPLPAPAVLVRPLRASSAFLANAISGSPRPITLSMPNTLPIRLVGRFNNCPAALVMASSPMAMALTPFSM